MAAGPRGRNLRLRIDPQAEAAADRVSAGERPACGTVSKERADPQLGLGQGQPLPLPERSYFEDRLDRDLAPLRVHRDVGAVAELGARALASGRDIAFAPGHFRPGTRGFREVLGHEIGHSFQQAGAGAAVQLDNGVTLKEAKAEEATEALEGGLAKIGEEAKDNEEFKAYGLSLAERLAPKLTGGEKGLLIGTGAAMYGLGVGTMLADPGGRQTLSGVNLAAPLKLYDKAVLQTFSFTLPPAPGGPLTLRFGLDGSGWLDELRGKGLPLSALTFDMTMTVGKDGAVSAPFALAHIGVNSWLDIQAGYGVTAELPNLQRSPDGGPLVPYQSYPQPAMAAPPGGAGFFVTVDVLKAPFLPKAVRGVLGGAPQAEPMRDR